MNRKRAAAGGRQAPHGCSTLGAMAFPTWITRRAQVWQAAVLAVFALGACAPRTLAPVRTSALWIAGHSEPAFAPDGPPDALRASLERLLSRGLVECDSAGAVQGALAERWVWSADSLTLTFTVREGLRYTNGAPITSADFAAALTAGLGREDHATRAWLLQAVRGIDKVRAGRPLPAGAALGVETPDARTLVLHLAKRDPLLLQRLATPGIATPFQQRAGIAWAQAVGAGPYRVLAGDAGRALTLVRADTCAWAIARVDTLRVRFIVGAPRVRTMLRAAGADLVWPLPPALLDEPLPASWSLVKRVAEPVRRLLLVFRADVPPTTQLPARNALAHAIDRRELFSAMGARAELSDLWLPGAGPFEPPSYDLTESQRWREQGHLGASFHILLGFDADGAGAEVARALQGQWARAGLYAELAPVRGPQVLAAPLAPVAPQALLVESQAAIPGAAAELATLVMPLRGPAVGGFRGGWRTREFDSWVAAPDAPAPLDAAAAQNRLAEQCLAIPIADLPWCWLQRSEGRAAAFHPRFGPEYATLRSFRSHTLNR